MDMNHSIPLLLIMIKSNQGIFQKTELEYPFSHFAEFPFVNPHFSSAYSKGIDKNIRCGVLLKF